MKLRPTDRFNGIRCFPTLEHRFETDIQTIEVFSPFRKPDYEAYADEDDMLEMQGLAILISDVTVTMTPSEIIETTLKDPYEQPHRNMPLSPLLKRKNTDYDSSRLN